MIWFPTTLDFPQSSQHEITINLVFIDPCAEKPTPLSKLHSRSSCLYALKLLGEEKKKYTIHFIKWKDHASQATSVYSWKDKILDTRQCTSAHETKQTSAARGLSKVSTCDSLEERIQLLYRVQLTYTVTIA